jgi:hypothetical protein
MLKNANKSRFSRLLLLFFMLCLGHESPLTAASMHRKKTNGNSAHSEEVHEKREWLFILDVAGKNSLWRFAIDTLNQVLAAAKKHDLSSVHIVCQNENYTFFRAANKRMSAKHLFDKSGVTRCFVEQGSYEPYWSSDDVDPSIRKRDSRHYVSGTKEITIDFITDAIKRFPANRIMYASWGHGSGCIDFGHWRTVKANNIVSMVGTDQDLFGPKKGFLFNDANNTYVSTPELGSIFKTISEEHLDGRKLDIVAFDSCHMAQIEIAAEVAPYASYIIFSQEVGVNFGWNYARVLPLFSHHLVSTDLIVSGIVQEYANEYSSASPTHGEITFKEYTLSAYTTETRLSERARKTPRLQRDADALIDSINRIAELCTHCLLSEKDSHIFKTLILSIRNSEASATHFYANSYIDLDLFIQSLCARLSAFLENKEVKAILANNSIKTPHREFYLELKELLTECGVCHELIKHVIPCNTVGSHYAGNPVKARGLSIYFPNHTIHSSYKNLSFAKGLEPGSKSPWFIFLETLLTRKSH